MRAERDQPAAPLMVWIALAALAVAGLLFLRYYSSSREADFASQLADSVDAMLADAIPGEVRVLGMGSSLLRAAAPAAWTLSSDASAPMRWRRITKGSLGLGHLGAAFALVERTPPDILVIEKNLLMDVVAQAPMFTMRKDASHRWRKWLSTLDRRFDPTRPLRNDQVSNTPCVDQAQPVATALLADEQPLRLAYQHSPDRAFAAALLRLAGRGVHVMIVDIPRSSAVEGITEQDKQRWLARLRQLLPPGPQVSYHTAPSYSQPALYCDARHLNGSGALLFQAWWWNELRQTQKALH